MEAEALPDPILLDLFEAARRQAPAVRALAILAAAFPGVSAAELGTLPAGERDRRLLAVREATFGPEAQCVTSCPSCASALEFSLPIPALLEEDPASQPSPRGGIASYQGYQVHFRLPTSQDLASLPLELSPQDARGRLLGACLLSAELEGKPVQYNDLPGAVIAEVTRSMEVLDPPGSLELSLHCPHCGHTWQAGLDAVAFVWEEISRKASQLLGEVLLLARASGWSEREILGLSPWRRRAYLELAYA